MITKWNFQTPTEEELHKRDKLASELELSPVVCLLLVQRGLTTVEEVKKFFKPSLNDLHDPFLMPDMEKAVKRLNKALGNKEKILIYGDYDVDGTTAVSLVYKYLRPYSSALDYYIPDRYDEGYGISYKGIDYARENGITLVISLDCGIKAIEKIEYAKQLGIDFIICDHHMPDDTLPEAVAVLGHTKSERITTMITDLVAHSGNGKINFSPEVEAAYAVLKDFMYATVYVDKEAKREEKKEDKLISELYARLCDEPALMPNFYMQIAYNEGVDRAVTDYISGMSDEFATHLFEELFVPQKWKVL